MGSAKVKKAINHDLFEKWRDIPKAERIKDPQYRKDLQTSYDRYRKPGRLILKEWGQTKRQRGPHGKKFQLRWRTPFQICP